MHSATATTTTAASAILLHRAMLQICFFIVIFSAMLMSITRIGAGPQVCWRAAHSSLMNRMQRKNVASSA
jgi:hypothetical protein